METGLFILSIIAFAAMILLMVIIALLKNVVFNPNSYIFAYRFTANKIAEMKSDKMAIAKAQKSVDDLRKRGYIVVLQISKEPVKATVVDSIPKPA